MKKLLSLSLMFLMLATIPAAMVKVYVDNSPYSVYGLPATHLKVYYGSQTNSMTNILMCPLTNAVNSNSYPAYDPFNCVTSVRSNQILFSIYGLTLNQQCYYAYAYVNSNGVETPLVLPKCGFTVTNNTDVILPPTNFRVVTN